MRKIAVPILGVALYPILMLAFPTERTIMRLWAAAMLTLASIAGAQVSRYISKKQAGALFIAAVGSLAAAMVSGLLSLRPETLEYELGLLAVIFVALGIPAHALLLKILEERRTRQGENGTLRNRICLK